MTTKEAIAVIEEGSKRGEPVQFACVNPHWWMGWDGLFSWSYPDSRDSSTLLHERFGDFDDDWERVK